MIWPDVCCNCIVPHDTVTCSMLSKVTASEKNIDSAVQSIRGITKVVFVVGVFDCIRLWVLTVLSPPFVSNTVIVPTRTGVFRC